MIEYKPSPNNLNHQVILDKKITGEIRFMSDWEKWQYFPKGQRTGGEMFDTLGDCKLSLEEGYTDDYRRAISGMAKGEIK